MQVKLYETTNRIEYIYRPETTAPNTLSASIGLAGGMPFSFLSLSSTAAAPAGTALSKTSSLSAVLAAGQVYAFAPAPPSACSTPRSLTVTGITADSATLNWTGNWRRRYVSNQLRAYGFYARYRWADGD